MSGSGRPCAWLLSAYHTDSHAAWCEWLMQNIHSVDWQLHALPARHFRWRIRGNPLSWLDHLRGPRPALIVATSMVDLATLVALRPELAGVPSLYYFHENQFAYPRSGRQHTSVDPQMVQLYGALSATRIAFNSHYNRDTFLHGIAQLMARMPDRRPGDLTKRLTAKAELLPVPVQAIARREKTPGLILWNHRWEYDKAPEVFVEAVSLLLQRDCDIRLALLGARAEPPHPALQRVRKMAATRIVSDGRLDPSDYREWVGRAQIVVSTAIHEFQGLAIIQAVSAGAQPVVPDALCYPEQYPQRCRYAPGNPVALADALQRQLESPSAETPGVNAWSGPNLLARWQSAVERLLN